MSPVRCSITSSQRTSIADITSDEFPHFYPARSPHDPLTKFFSTIPGLYPPQRKIERNGSGKSESSRAEFEECHIIKNARLHGESELFRGGRSVRKDFHTPKREDVAHGKIGQNSGRTCKTRSQALVTRDRADHHVTKKSHRFSHIFHIP